MTALPCYGSTNKGNIFPAGTKVYIPVANNGFAKGSSQTETQVIYETAGTFSSLSILIAASTTTGASGYNLQVNGVDVTENISIPAATTGNFQDLINTDTIIATDLVGSVLNGGSSGTMDVPATYVLFAAAVNSVGRHVMTSKLNNQVFNGPGGKSCNPISGNQQSADTIPAGGTGETDQAQVYCSIPATFVNFLALVVSNTLGDSCRVAFHINTISGTLALSITASTSGTFEDLVNSDAVVPADLINYFVNTGAAAGAISLGVLGTEMVSTADQSLCVLGIGSANATIAPTSFLYWPIGGGADTPDAVELQFKTVALSAGDFGNLATLVSFNDLATASNVILYLNSVFTALVVLIPASTTGYFLDLVDTVTVIVSDKLSYNVTTGDPGTGINIDEISMSFTAGAPPPATRIKDVIRGPGIVVRPR